ncbi:MAG: bifunctional diaminohydroxyphosphoribosylaminopyrimidine deaminase/5-amino-6-(5-phosphoribosylamino)uracil reductase RibD [Gemmatimonadota bacterium]|nr:bifunctional diaminohydroxyphosphoribosylaminopyrimidine deaminase/5-amino-6-(5-phosphoribosylamino)uracil reductase RibD [Gemmatimonadota bacterium]MDQ8147152.1 bifunctional diaminohydroxyphosphoribosylaminopyrimidine deaminase/5-amino-6-(5-phosphoribosylamino)uracil reductase RibD [Gemmatimonadota bacterium]MDQ8149031.1 bifunctional diaminohydroxyphosphoribosylaminopyrimidine deaminase/5-amino-6-(5-phosphoribosylamino)uracil reductase RibD [Gemmatimonadota bacterium]MDQ8156484.1 bifunctiona
MRRALRVARRGWGWTAPNPLVGAVVVRDGVVIAEGWHAAYGGPHAEVMALGAAGDRARGADLYVTLEPCTHHGQTPPCTDAIIAAGIARVIVAVEDPNPQARGGVEVLRAAGIPVTTGVERAAAADLNAPFLFAHRDTSRPFVTLKLAIAADGMLAPASRERTQLTGPAAVRAVHRLRAGVDAVGVGMGTAIADEPQLTVRFGRRPRVTPVRVVFGAPDRLPTGSALVRTAARRPTWVVASGAGAPADAGTGAAHRAGDPGEPLAGSVGVRVLRAPTLRAQLGRLRAAGVRHLLVEGGAALGAAFLEAGLVDRLVIFEAPVLLGAGAIPAPPGTPSAGGRPPEGWRLVSRRTLGADLESVWAPIDR